MPQFASDVGRVADAIPDALVMLEPDGTVSWLNRATIDLLGIDPVAWSGRTLPDLLADGEHPHPVEELGSTVDEIVLRDGTGRRRRLTVAARTIPTGTHGTGFTVLSLRESA